jgi:hypothetical protein
MSKQQKTSTQPTQKTIPFTMKTKNNWYLRPTIRDKWTFSQVNHSCTIPSKRYKRRQGQVRYVPKVTIDEHVIHGHPDPHFPQDSLQRVLGVVYGAWAEIVPSELDRFHKCGRSLYCLFSNYPQSFRM